MESRHAETSNWLIISWYDKFNQANIRQTVSVNLEKKKPSMNIKNKFETYKQEKEKLKRSVNFI
jgi:hypothetical protein